MCRALIRLPLETINFFPALISNSAIVPFKCSRLTSIFASLEEILYLSFAKNRSTISWSFNPKA